MGCAKGDDANGATAQGGAVSSEGRCDPVAGCLRPNNTVVRSKHPLRCPIPALRDPSGRALGRSFARSLTRQTARKAPSHWVAVKSRAHRVALLGIVVLATTCVARLMIIPIFTSNALSEDLFRASLSIIPLFGMKHGSVFCSFARFL
jgi:hypothetical protein